MRSFWSKYIYLVVLAAISIAIALQVLWIDTLYRSQKSLLEKQVERIVNESSMLSIYQSLGGERIANKEFKEFLFSPQWMQFRNAFDNSRIRGLKSYFEYDITPDSVELKLQFQLKNPDRLPDNSPVGKTESSVDRYVESTRDSLSLQFMDSVVRARLTALGGISTYFHALYGYGKDTVLTGANTIEQIKAADYTSDTYSYNLHHFAKYQLVIPSLTGAVLYQLRYFLISSLIMVMITSLAFYFLLYFIRMQRMLVEARMEFISNMTHEFKTPVATVFLALESIIKYKLENDKEKLYEYIQMSKLELERLNYMIEKVLNLKPNENASTALTMEVVDIQGLLKEVIDSLALQCEKKNARTHFEGCPQDIQVLGDRIHLSNVFFNILDNALKYSLQAPLIRINCQAGNRTVTLSIKDNGIGIDPGYHTRIFERFFRVPTFDTHTIRGAGLGLHYVQEVLARHKGSIKVHSSIGAGSTFIIQLPRYEKT